MQTKKKQVTFFDMEKTGSNPNIDEIINIHIRRDGKTIIWLREEYREDKIIDSFFDFLEYIWRKDEIFVCYGAKFDLAFIDMRMRKLGIWSEKRWNLLFNWLNWFDLYQYFGANYVKLRDLVKLFDNRERPTTSYNIRELFFNKEYDKIREYVEEELILIETLYRIVIFNMNMRKYGYKVLGIYT